MFQHGLLPPQTWIEFFNWKWAIFNFSWKSAEIYQLQWISALCRISKLLILSFWFQPKLHNLPYYISLCSVENQTLVENQTYELIFQAKISSLRSRISFKRTHKSILFISAKRRWKSCRLPSLYLERKSFFFSPLLRFFACFWSNSSCSRVVVFSLL